MIQGQGQSPRSFVNFAHEILSPPGSKEDISVLRLG
ncbi:unannotated protein [freshwater metagenome]|uniref:Unannotated protein n=1 Tax=freshwater metagenome TaxID=449393 RepID=A0A6J5ZZD9_9ZZZZ